MSDYDGTARGNALGAQSAEYLSKASQQANNINAPQPPAAELMKKDFLGMIDMMQHLNISKRGFMERMIGSQPEKKGSQRTVLILPAI